MYFRNNMVVKNKLAKRQTNRNGVESDNYLTLGVATAQRCVDENKKDWEEDAGKGEDDAVELVDHKAEGSDED